jgi:NACHT domain/Restriction endonuclease
MTHPTRATLESIALHVVREVGEERPHHRRPQDYFVEPWLEAADGALVRASSIFQHASRRLILGVAGTGKSTLLRYTASRLAHAFLEKRTDTCPFLVQARDISLDAAFSLEGVVAARLADVLDVPLPDASIDELLERGTLWLFIDGLDELSRCSGREAMETLVHEFRRRPRLPAVISARPANLSIPFSGFTVYALTGFDQSEVGSLIDKLAGERPELGDRFRAAVLGNATLQPLLGSPFMVHLLWTIFESRGQIPENPTFLYSDFTDYLLSNRERAKELGPRSTFTLQQEQDVLELLAIRILETSRHTFDVKDVEIALGDLRISETADAGGMIEELLHTGLLVRQNTALSFVHVSFVEYFAARGLSKRPGDAVRLLDTREGEAVLVFACALMDDIAPLVEAAVQRKRVLLAAKCISLGKTRNPQLSGYVVQEFKREVGEPFLRLLTIPAEDAHPSSEEVRPSASLLDMLDAACDKRIPHHERGARFEGFSERLFGEVFKVISKDLNTENGELDLVLEIVRSEPFWLEFGGDVLVECKNWTSNVPLREVGVFLSKVNLARVRLAFFVSVSGFTEDAQRNLRNHAANVSAPLVVPLTGTEIKTALAQGAVLQEFFKEAIRRMKYLRKY